MRFLDCYFGRCTKPSCDGCSLRLIRSLRLRLKSRTMDRCDDVAIDVTDAWKKSEPMPDLAGKVPVPKEAVVKKRKRLLAPREEIPWFPTIKPSLCNGCGDCKILCKPGVFELGPPDPTGVQRPKLVVAHPYNCLVLCNRCVPICTSGAIVLPRKEDFEHFVEYVE